ncbi:hypothetical protein [Rhizobium leguminosarum]|uniref:Uncharacterized protein n=1 Tax=Rhizobium leguminosarum TaxID=384 RepID=A0A1B1C785_RHILE|nr:hypothetical protein [Rhizobium leguminosarum]ANP85601.1 hypothetical protein BA011_07550 [Rhizobium leguminosarum]
MPFFNLVRARMLIDAESRDHALEKFLSAHKSGIDPTGLWISEDMFSPDDFPNIDLVADETLRSVKVKAVIREGRCHCQFRGFAVHG